MKLIVKDNLDLLKIKIVQLKQDVSLVGNSWAKNAVMFFDQTYRDWLQTQGRSGQPPPLSEITKKIYAIKGEPDGSGIRNHIRIEKQQYKKSTSYTLGIPKGNPTKIALTQNNGAIRAVTEETRSYFSQFNIHLSPNTRFIHIPARYSWTGSLKIAKKEAIKNLKKKFNNLY